MRKSTAATLIDPPSSDDMCAPESLDLLNKAGLDFDKHDRYGIDVEHFGELLITSGLALFDDVKWVSFHRCVGTGWGAVKGGRRADTCPEAATTSATSSRLSRPFPSRRKRPTFSTYCDSGFPASTTSSI